MKKDRGEMFIAERVAEFADGLSLDKIPKDVVERAKIQILNNLAAAYAGFSASRDEFSKLKKNLETFFRSDEHGVPVPVVGLGDSSLPVSLILNSSMSMVHDWDDYLFAGHTGHSAVFASLATSIYAKATGKDFLTAVVLGNEVGARMGISCVFGPLNGQMMSFIHGAICCTVYLKIIGEEKRIPDALSFYFSQPPFPSPAGFMSGKTKYFTASLPSLSGLLASQIALSNFSCHRGIFEHRNGFLSNFSFKPIKEAFDDMGKVWLSKTLSYKYYPGCAYVLSPLEAFLNIKRKEGEKVRPEKIENILVRTSHITYLMDKMSSGFITDFTSHIPTNFSTYISIALASIFDEFTTESFSHILKNKSKIAAMCGKIKVKPDFAMTQSIINSLNTSFPYLTKGLSVKKITESLMRLSKMGLLIRPGISDIPKVLETLFWRAFGSVSGSGFDHSEQLDNFSLPFSAEVKVVTKDTEIKEFVKIHRGAAGYPLSEIKRDISEKFLSSARKIYSEKKSNEILSRIENMEKEKVVDIF